MKIENHYPISLLWPTDESKIKFQEAFMLSDRGEVDLGVDLIVSSLCLNRDYFHKMKQLFVNLCDDPEVIGYRHDILEEFMNFPEFCSELEGVIPIIHKLENLSDPKFMVGVEKLRKIAWQLEILEMYSECITRLHSVFQKFSNVLKSKGLRRLLQFIEDITHSNDYQSMIAELPDLRAKLQSITCVTIGINLDNELRPAEAIFLTVEPKHYQEHKRSLVSSILGLKSANETYQGIAQYQNILRNGNSPLETALFKNLEEIFNSTLLPIGAALQRYIHINVQNVIGMQLDILFYVGAAKLFARLGSIGLDMCKPKIAPAEDRVFKVEGMTDLILSLNLNRQYPNSQLNKTITDNDVEFGPEGRVFILTGPNQGGKTTYTRAIGITQLLFQAGLFIPGSNAYISPVDWIYTHFSEEELPNANNGRLGEESRRLSEIFEKSTSQSLILLNESLSSTSASDSLYLARDLVKGIKLIGCRAVFATHLLELAVNVDTINEQLDNDSKLISMVAGILQTEELDLSNNPVTRRTYKVKQGPPLEMSYARDIAYRFGISFEQIVEKLKSRNL